MIIPLILSLFVFLALFIGIIVAHFVREELVAGKKYFIWLQKLVVSTIVFMLFYWWIGLWSIIISVLLLAALLLLIKDKSIHPLIYWLLGLAVLINKPVLFSLIFLYSLPTGTLLFKDDKKKFWVVVLMGLKKYWPYLLFMIIGFVLREVLFQPQSSLL